MRRSSYNIYNNHHEMADAGSPPTEAASNSPSIEMATGIKFQNIRKSIDYSPHEVFVELAELHQNSYGGLEWSQISRWVKYEEDVELISNRWGKPHVPFLNFAALFALRNGLEKAALLLDIGDHALTQISMKIAEEMVQSQQIPSHQKDSVFKLLLLNHKHVKESIGPLRRASRFVSGLDEDSHYSETATPNMTRNRKRSSIRKSLANIFRNNMDGNDEKIEIRNSFAQLQIDAGGEDKDIIINYDLKKRLADGSQACACLVASVDFLLEPAFAFVRLAEGIMMDNFVEVPIPTRFIFVLLGPYESGIDYREVGKSISTLMIDKTFQDTIYKAQSRDQIITALSDYLNSSIIFPPLDWRNNELFPVNEIKSRTRENIRNIEEIRAKKLLAEEQEKMKTEKPDKVKDKVVKVKPIETTKPPRDPLIRRGIPFYGVIQDMKERYPKYISDITDGLNSQTLSSTIFIFFAALSPAITFGGIYGGKTKKLIGVGETLLTSSINGVIFALFAAQPLLIVGATGPLMAFDMSILNFCKNMDIDFLSIRFWIGIWILAIGLLVGATEAMVIVKKFTKFTEEIFSVLICTIFIAGAFENLAEIFKQHPLFRSTEPSCLELNETNITGVFDMDKFDDIFLNETSLNKTKVEEKDDKIRNQPNTALFCLILMIGTFVLAIRLKKFRNSTYFGRGVRRAIGDFGVPISILLFVIIANVVSDIYTEKLGMPEGLQPSNAEVRGWLINPFGVEKPLPVWCIFAAAPASLLLFILIFIEENICQLILSKPERGLKKGSGFHLDIMLSCLINTISGILGAPFMSPACVRTIAHMSSLTIMSDNVPPGESPKIAGCIEQRLSSFVVSVLIGLAVLLYAILNLVPNAVLLGVFLYMGVSAFAGIQFFERTFLFIMPNKYHPNTPYAKNVRTFKMHIFTSIQLVMLAILWIVKQSPAGLAVPFILICLIPLRLFILPCIFTVPELVALDGAKPPEEAAEEDEPDFYETVHDLPTQIETLD